MSFEEKLANMNINGKDKVAIRDLKRKYCKDNHEIKEAIDKVTSKYFTDMIRCELLKELGLE